MTYNTFISRKVFFLLLLMHCYSLHSMNQNLQQFILPEEIIIKIFACVSLETKKSFRLTCKKILYYDIKEIIQHSPLILSRKDHLTWMICCAQCDNAELFKNLLYNAPLCNHSDILNTVSYFLPENSHESVKIKNYLQHKDHKTIEQLLSCIMTVYKGDKPIIDQYIVNHETYTEENISINPLIIAILKKHPYAISELLLTQNIQLLNSIENEYKCTPLLDAVYMNNIEMCKFLLSFKEIAINIPNKDGWTPLALAACNGYADIVQLFIDYIKTHGLISEILKQPEIPINYTSWYCAIIGGHVDILETLLTLIEFEIPYKIKPLHVATINDQTEIVQMLVKCDKTDINAIEDNGITALHFAALHNNLQIAKILLDHGANPNEDSNEDRETPLDIAQDEGYTDMVALLKTYMLLNQYDANNSV